jgi:hypothetical protein
MGKFQDLTGQVFGKLTVGGLSEKTNARNELYWNCVCECGNTRVALGHSMKRGHITSCGCDDDKRPNLINKRFGKLIAIRLNPDAARGRGNQRLWDCLCDCGNQITVNTNKLLSQKKQSCGCNGEQKRNSHGLSHLPEYNIWKGMRQRCKLDPGYIKRGITVCPEWDESFEQFLNDVGRRPSYKHQLDRRDSLGNYNKANVRWLEGNENGRNKTVNRLLEFNGEIKCATEWAEIFRIKPVTLFVRLHKGWNIEKALTTPIRKRTVYKDPNKVIREEMPEYKIWASIKARCKRKHSYVSRNIKMCSEWESSFEAFYEYLLDTIGLRPSPQHQLDRVNALEGYCLGNLRWLTPSENMRNTTVNRLITYQGKTQTLADWSDETGINRGTLAKRLESWSVEDAFERPIDIRKTGGNSIN